MVRGSGKKNIQKVVLRGNFGLKFILGKLGRLERPFQFFGVFSLSAPSLVMTKGLLTFAGPQNAQNPKTPKPHSEIILKEIWMRYLLAKNSKDCKDNKNSKNVDNL